MVKRQVFVINPMHLGYIQPHSFSKFPEIPITVKLNSQKYTYHKLILYNPWNLSPFSEVMVSSTISIFEPIQIQINDQIRDYFYLNNNRN